MGAGEGKRKNVPLYIPFAPQMGFQDDKHKSASSAGIEAQSLPTRLPSRRVLKSKRILPGENEIPIIFN